MESGAYPSIELIGEWSLSQMDYYYNNCHKYGLDPSFEEDDVATEDGGIANEMRHEDVDSEALCIDNDGAKLGDVSNRVANNASCSNGTGIIVGWDPNSVRVMVISQSSQLMNLLLIKDKPWLLMGDFNVILDPSKRSAGSSSFMSDMEDFRDCLGEIGVEDLVMSGLKFTWNKSPGKTDGLLKKLDRVMSNLDFMEKFVNANALFLPFVASDHTPVVVEIPMISRAKPRPFKFVNFLANKTEFLPIIKEVWDRKIIGHAMFSVVSKLKLLKKPLRKLKYAQGDLARKVTVLKQELERVQANMVNDSHNANLRTKEMDCLKAYNDAVRDEELMLKQRAKVEWLSEGDFNTKFFHKTIKEKLNRNRVENVEDMNGKLSLEDADFMVRPVTREEIKQGMKFVWLSSIFFKNGKLLKEVNATIIALVPKSQTPKKVLDFRPISCCNVLYKAILKIIANRIKGFLGKLVDECQNAFIPSRQISNNILLTQELMRNYHRERGPNKVAFKIDIHKVYDSVEWEFMKQCLVHFGFHKNMISWIMSCLLSPSFTVNVNGDHEGYFKGMRCLRQGDPLSPYLFTLVMEVFSLMVRRKIDEDGDFKYHWRCDRLKLTHLSFADDLMVFSKADVHSVEILSNALKEFSGVSGLVPNLDKSSVFFGNVPEHLKARILNILPLAVGVLPVRYLGLPLISSRLYKHHCSSLLDKVKKRLLNWKNKSLSFVGRLQLIKSVVSSIQVYWSSAFVLPKAVNAEIEQLMRGFLWSHGVLLKGQAKVSWKDVLVDRCSNERNFWDIPELNDVCWSWRKILQCRDALRNHIVYRIGDGSMVSTWFDNWLFFGPLSQFITKRDIFEAGLSLNCKLGQFSVKSAWSDLTVSKPVVPWYKMVWFSQNIPRHAFIFWLAINRRLKTQDRIASWQVWCHFKEMVRLQFAPNSLSEIVPYVCGRPLNKSVWSISQRLVIGALVYFIWQERNLRFFQQKNRTFSDLCGIIKENVRLRLLSLKIRGSRQAKEAAGIWDFGVVNCNGGKNVKFCLNG
ncbi:putative RNA-directed DNA polymerase [Tanacetum coccineum]|uniref:RNA-directed DNA polymerase n=1 Tax=Tanacetum coccineum TaxID=301880 RepID=A0ABQ5GPZ6_9ASTR